ncbi:extracellular solute-binding protein [candidate division KSB3 bacterium]|uniref:Extracellular solute-binding protein n=1 Tax=candidate division KSB3 bacterium TaxID=2044937 RepID=A0A9D5JSS7_9BACT|nr:extracellular solute-binding protein [candidate division KSB3 bacterium]MBD3323374.1 extracellular solute-binding protein [candidate division KSB3 bacterium]
MKKCHLTLTVLLSLGVLITGIGTQDLAAQPYEGVKLRLALISGFTECPPIYDALSAAAEELGAEVEISWYSNDELHDKLLIDFTGGNPVWDIVFVHSPSRGEWVESGLIVPIGQWIEEHPDTVDHDLLALDDYFDISINNYTYNGVWIGPPLFVTGVAMFYRTDLFNHPTEQENFNAQYGYDLQVPETYKQFRDIAEFFTRKKGETLAGETLEADFYGTAHSNKPTGFLWFDFMNYLMAFGADNIYDPETMTPTFSSPESIAAGEYYVSLVPFLPPGHMSMASGQSTSMFAEGSVAMIIEYFLRGMQMTIDPEKSKVSDKVEFTLLPSVQGVEGREHAANHGGNVLAIYGLSKNKEAAYKTIELGFSKRIMKQVFLEKYAPYGWIPPRPSVLLDPDVQQAAPILAEAVKKLMEPEGIAYFDVPAQPEYFQAMDIAATALSKALTGDVDVTSAFNDAQTELEEFFKRAGLLE